MTLCGRCCLKGHGEHPSCEHVFQNASAMSPTSDTGTCHQVKPKSMGQRTQPATLCICCTNVETPAKPLTQSQTLQCWCYLPTFANVGLRRNIGVYKANIALRGIHPKCWFDTCTFDNSPAIKSRQITVLHECTPSLAYIWPKCMPTMAYIQSDNHTKSRSITPNHGIRQIIDSDKPNVAKLCLHTECCSERLHLNVSKYDQHGVCGNGSVQLEQVQSSESQH